MIKQRLFSRYISDNPSLAYRFKDEERLYESFDLFVKRVSDFFEIKPLAKLISIQYINNGSNICTECVLIYEEE